MNAVPMDFPTVGPRTVREALVQAVTARVRKHRRFLRLILFGLLWAVAITAIEMANIPNALATVDDFVLVTATFLNNFSAESVVFVVAFHWWGSRRASWLQLAIIVFGVATISSAVTEFTGFSGLFLRDRPTYVTLLRGASHWDPFVWNAWLGTIYGGFAAIIYALRHRIDGTTRALADATLARERNEAAIAEARVQSLVERIEPTFLLDVMDAARRFYQTDVARAEAIINECVEFLRTAMPQIRSGHSTLEAELDVAESFLSLVALTRDGCPTWSIERGDDREIDGVAAKLALPPLVLLPVLERLMTSTASATRSLRVALSRDAADLHLTIDSPAGDRDAVETERLDAIGARLRLACGGTIALDAGPDGGVRYVVELPDAIKPRASPCALSSPALSEPQAARLEN